MKRWYLIKPDGTVEERPAKFHQIMASDDADAQLKLLQSSVGGWVEHVQLDKHTELWCNEEGKLRNLPYNPRATLIWVAFFGQTDTICGPVLVSLDEPVNRVVESILGPHIDPVIEFLYG